MAVVFSNVPFITPNMSGYKECAGFANIGTYLTDGVQMNLQNYLDDAGYPVVICSNPGGYVLEHNKGTAAAGKVLAYYSYLNGKNGIDQNATLFQVTNGTNLAATQFSFIAKGKAY